MRRALVPACLAALACSTTKKPMTTATGGGGAGGGAGGAGGAATGLGGGGGGMATDMGTFPLAVSANKRYLVGHDGTPFLVAGDAPQCLTVKLSTADMDAYFAMRARQGFNAAWVNLLCTTYTGGTADAATYDGIVPFTAKLGDGRYDLTKPNTAFFARVDAAVDAAAAHGVLLFLDPIETGGFLDTLRSNGLPNARAYGRFLGQRYVGADNITWMSGNDLRAWQSATDDALVHEVALGIKDTDTRHLQTVELDPPTMMSSLDDPTWVPTIDINLTYTYYPTYAQLYVDYNRTNHLPNVMIEANYENENVSSAPHITNAHDCRTQFYWTNLSGGTGSFYGNKDIWPVLSTWAAHMTDPGAVQMGYVQTLFLPRAWWRLVPDQNNTVVTAGLGTLATTGSAQDNDYATTARTDDGTLVMTYMPTARAVTVDMTKLAGAATARWYDPTTGTWTAITGSPFANTGTHVFTPPTAKHADSYSDWVLVLETTPP
jgi:hypothetical protein